MKQIKFYIIITLLILLNIFILFKWYDSNKINKRLYDNCLIVEDSIKILQDKNKEFFAQNNAYILELNDLKKINKDLVNEINNLKENPLIVEKIITKSVVDTILLNSNVDKYFNNGIYSFANNFNYEQTFDSNNYIKLNGVSNLSIDTLFNIKTNNTYLNHLNIGTDLTLSFTEYKNELHINAKSNNPLISFTQINGYILNKDMYKVIKKYSKPKRFYFGVGFNYQYNFQSSKLEPGVGVSVGLKIFEF